MVFDKDRFLIQVVAFWCEGASQMFNAKLIAPFTSETMLDPDGTREKGPPSQNARCSFKRETEQWLVHPGPRHQDFGAPRSQNPPKTNHLLSLALSVDALFLCLYLTDGLDSHKSNNPYYWKLWMFERWLENATKWLWNLKPLNFWVSAFIEFQRKKS